MATFQAVCFVALLPVLIRAQYFLTEPTNVDVIIGDEVTLQCTFAGSYNAKVYWSVPSDRDRLIGPDYDVPDLFLDQFEIVGEPLRHEYNLKIKQASLLDAGTYNCVLIWDDGLRITSKDATVEVVEIHNDGSPTCVLEGGQVATEGEDRNLLCLSTDASLDLRWQRNGIDLSRSDTTSAFAPNAVISTIKAQSLDHQQEYKCVAQNGNLPACSVILSVRYKPKVTVESVGSSNTGSDGQYDCIADGYPGAFAYTWYYNDYEIQFVEHSRFNRVRLQNNGATLILPDLGKEDGGVTIRCDVLNEVGTGMASFNVTLTTSKSLAQIVGPIMLGAILALVAIMLFLYYCWWKHQQGRLKRIIKKRLPAPRTNSTIPTITGPAMRLSSKYVIPRSGLDLESVGYGPEDNLGYTRDEDAFRDFGDDGDDNDGIRPIPRKKSVSSSSGIRANGSDSDNDFIVRDAEVDDEETNKMYTYHVNPNFPELNSKKGFAKNSYNPNDESNAVTLDFLDGPSAGPGGEMVSTEL